MNKGENRLTKYFAASSGLSKYLLPKTILLFKIGSEKSSFCSKTHKLPIF